MESFKDSPHAQLLNSLPKIGLNIGNNSGFNGMARRSATPLGVIVNEDYTSMGSTSNYVIANPTSTWSITGGFLNSTNTTGTNYGVDYIKFNNYLGNSTRNYTILDRWTQTLTLFVRSVSATSLGVYIGITDEQANGSDQYWGFVNCSTGSTGIMVIYYNSSNVALDLTVRTIAANDKLVLTFSRNYNTMTFNVTNVTKGWTNTLTYSSNTMSNTTIGTPSMGRFTIGNRGGNYDLALMQVSSTVEKDVDVCFIGHSIPAGYNATAENRAWPNRAMEHHPSKSFTKLCCQANYLGDMLNMLNEALYINAKTYVMMDARNDISIGQTTAQWQASYETWIAALESIGAKIILPMAISNNSPDMRTFNSYVSTKANYPIIDLFNDDTLSAPSSMVANYKGDSTSDGTHPGIEGHRKKGQGAAPYLI